jgi:hypothetical protein
MLGRGGGGSDLAGLVGVDGGGARDGGLTSQVTAGSASRRYACVGAWYPRRSGADGNRTRLGEVDMPAWGLGTRDGSERTFEQVEAALSICLRGGLVPATHP